MREMSARGIEPRAIAGRIRCFVASQVASQFRVIGVDVDVLSTDRREPSESHREHPLEDDREEEDRDGNADQR
jgi:hypothetical protein